MSNLQIVKGGAVTAIPFVPPAALDDLLASAGFAVAHPCGGRGSCGKCAVEITGAVSAPTAQELRTGTRLSCQITLLGDAAVTLPDEAPMQIETADGAIGRGRPLAAGYGAAIDIGTTTLAAHLYDLATGERLAAAGCENPQCAVAADVMGRIGAAMEGESARLQAQVTDAVCDLLARMKSSAGISAVNTAVIAGNTTMLYLLTGRDPTCLSHAPFVADTLFGGFDTLAGMTVYYPPCMDAFVGADITCAVLASGMTELAAPQLLCDIGTNGEIALWKDGRLYVTSTAAGPAFEGAGISCGCGSIAGAIDRVWAENGRICAHTIGEAPAVGICGSGLIDAVAALLARGDVDETGAAEAKSLSLQDGVSLLQEDIRAVQLAKAAIAAGIQTLLADAGVAEGEIENLFIAGGFGSHLNATSAAAIGLIPRALAKKVRVLGNASLTGAGMLLLDEEKLAQAAAIVQKAIPVALGGNPKFNEAYIEQMLFPEE